MGDISPELGVAGFPGLSAKQSTSSRKFLTDNNHIVRRGVKIDDTSVDSYGGHTPTTHLRGGLALVRVEAAGPNQGKYVPIGHADAPAAPDIVMAGFLMEDVNMLSKAGSGAVEDKQASIVIHGFVDADLVIYGTADAPTIQAIKDALPLIQFEEPLP